MRQAPRSAEREEREGGGGDRWGVEREWRERESERQRGKTRLDREQTERKWGNFVLDIGKTQLCVKENIETRIRVNRQRGRRGERREVCGF